MKHTTARRTEPGSAATFAAAIASLVAGASFAAGGELPPPGEAFLAEAASTAAAIRRAVAEGTARGVHEHVFLDVAGAVNRVQVISASEASIVVSYQGVEMPIPWEKLAPARMYSLGRRYLNDAAESHAALARYCIASGLLKEAGDEIGLALGLDPSLRPSLQTAMDALDKMLAARRERPAPPPAKRPPRPTVRVSKTVGALMARLGRRHFMLGVASAPGDKWLAETREQGCLWDMRYQYLAGGVNTQGNWKVWNRPEGVFVANYLKESERLGTIPVFTWYQMYQSLPGSAAAGGNEPLSNKLNCESTSTMRQYFSDLILFMQKAGEWGKPVILHVEPDLWGFWLLAQEFRPNEPDTIKVAVRSTGLADVAEFEDTMAGFGKAIVALRDRYAPNVLLGWHASMWGRPSTKKFAEAIRSCGKWDIIFTDPSDRDAGWKLAHNYRASGAWWKDSDFAAFRDWSGELHKLTGLPLIAWQIPVGNTIMAACNNTEGHYMDNRPQYWLEDYPANPHLAEFASQGYVALLFGGGAGGCTSFTDSAKDGVTNPPPIEGNRGEQSQFPDDDGGYLRMRAARYYAAPLVLRPGAD